MSVEIKAGWIYATRELEKQIQEAGGGEVTSDSIVDATDVGKSVLTSATAAAVRAVIGAGTSSFTGSYADLSNKPTIPAAATVDNLGGAGTTGKAVMKATSAEAARTAIGAGTSNLTIGTTASTAKAGNYTPTTNEVAASLKAKAEIAALVGIADPAEATVEDVATAVNAIIAALKA